MYSTACARTCGGFHLSSTARSSNGTGIGWRRRYAVVVVGSRCKLLARCLTTYLPVHGRCGGVVRCCVVLRQTKTTEEGAVMMRDAVRQDMFVYLADAAWLKAEESRLRHKFRAAVRVVAICNVFMRPLLRHLARYNVKYVAHHAHTLATPCHHGLTNLHCVCRVLIAAASMPSPPRCSWTRVVAWHARAVHRA